MLQNSASITTLFKNIQLVIFDLDGTLYDQRKLRLKLYLIFIIRLLFFRIRLHDLRIVSEFRKQREKHKGFSSASLDEDQYKWCAEKTGIPIEEIKKIIFNLMYHLPLNHLRNAAYPGINLFLTNLRQSGKKLAVYSDYPVDKKLAVLGITVDKTFCSTQKNIAQFKPSKKGALSICESFDCKPEHVLFIGDREDTDGESARMAGMHFLKVNTKKARKGTFYTNLNNQIENDRKN